MSEDIPDQRRVFGWALPASLAAHLLIIALLIFGLPVSLPPPQKEEAITVDLVPPPEPPAKAKAEPSPPAQESRPDESQKANVEIPPPKSKDAPRRETSPVVTPVFQFGEKHAGPRKSPDGNSAKDGSASATALSEPVKQDLAGPPTLTAAEAKNPAPQPGTPETPAPADAAEVQVNLQLEEAQTLFSHTATSSPIATTALGDEPRGARAARLCVTELREQLRHASPPYFPELLPSYRLEDGTVIEDPVAAFLGNGQWYNLSFRCEVDSEATKVVTFAFRVGDTVPRSEWKRRGLPSQ
ncbi:MAG: DUF930 domain-containing protein [Mesorhizobium sp.]